MENIGELIWFMAYLIQTFTLFAGAGSVMIIGFAALYEIVCRKARDSRLPVSGVSLRGHAERV